MPCINSFFGHLADAKYLTTIDVRGAYHHIQLSKSAAPKTAFLTDMGKFQKVSVCASSIWSYKCTCILSGTHEYDITWHREFCISIPW